MAGVYTLKYKCSCIHHALICTKMYHVLLNGSGYAEERTDVKYRTSSCYYNCTVDVSMAPRCRNHANVSVTSSPPSNNQSVLAPNGLHYNISDLQRCQRYTVEVTAQVGAHKYTNQTQDTVMLRKNALFDETNIWMIQSERMQISRQCLVKYIIMNHTLYIIYMYAIYSGLNVNLFMGLEESQVEVLLRKVRLHRQHL